MLTLAVKVNQSPPRSALVERTLSALRDLVGDAGSGSVQLLQLVGGGLRVQPSLPTVVEDAVYLIVWNGEVISSEVQLLTFWRDSFPGIVSAEEAGQIVHIIMPSVRTAADLVLGAAAAVAVAREGDGRINDLSAALVREESIDPEDFLRLAQVGQEVPTRDRLAVFASRLPIEKLS